MALELQRPEQTQDLQKYIQDGVQELLERLPLRYTEFPSSPIFEKLSKALEWIRNYSYEDPAKLLVLVEQIKEKKILCVRLELKSKKEAFQRAVLSLIFREDQTVFTAYEQHSYVVAPPKNIEEEASLAVLEVFRKFIEDALIINPRNNPSIT